MDAYANCIPPGAGELGGALHREKVMPRAKFEICWESVHVGIALIQHIMKRKGRKS